MSVDLLAKLANSGDTKKLQVINSLLTNVEENPFNQLSAANVKTYGEGSLACGSVIEAAVKKLWGDGVAMTYYSYHKPITLDSNEATLGWDKITYDSKYLANNRKVIKNKLTSGIPVRVGAVYDPKPGMLAANKALQPTHDGGHFLLIVGCNDSATKFLYIDPFPGGSILKYTGGYVSKSYEEKCRFLGEFELQENTNIHTSKGLYNRGPTLRKSKATGGAPFFNDLEVMAGPIG